MYRMRRVPSKNARRLMLAAVAGGVELWLITTQKLSMGEPAFEVLCGLSCWLPAWFSADLLSGPRTAAGAHREWTAREVGRRWVARLLPVLVILGLWCGTYTLRSLQADLRVKTPRFMANISDPADLTHVWIAWTAVFLASSIAYSAGAGLCSSLARRPKRWLVTPSVVVGASLALALFAWAGLYAAVGSFQPLPFMNGISLLESARQILTVPNYLAGSTVALGTVQILDLRHQDWVEWIGRYVPSGLAIYCWIATLLFVLISIVSLAGIFRIARNRARRHPNTSQCMAESAEAAVMQPG